MKNILEITQRQKIMVMVGALLAMLLAALDQTIIGTAMPTIVKEMNGLEHFSWVFTAYMLASTVSVPIVGKLSDIYGRKLFFIGGIIVFLIGSILAGQSHSMEQLIAFRAIQGLGAGTIMTNAFAIIGDLFAPAERGKWQGTFGGVFGLASVIGPTLGGYLTDNISWRWTFYINIPIAILAMAFIYFLMPTIKSQIKGKRSIDFLGAILLVMGLVPFLLGLVWGGNQFPWMSWQTIGLFLFAIVSLISFGFVEQKAKEPIIPLSLFKSKIFSVSVITTFFIAMGMFGAIVYIPLFAQGVLGISATDSGFILTPMMVGLIISSALSGQLVSRTQKYKILAITGTALVTLAMIMMSFIGVHTSQLDLYIRMIILGLGLGITMPIFNIVVQNAFPQTELGVVTAGIQLFRSIGGTVGTAIMGSVLNNGLVSRVKEISQDPFLTQMSKANPTLSIEKFDANTAQGFLSADMQTKIQTQLLHLPQTMQPQAMQNFTDFVTKIKLILATSISEVFVIGSFLMAIALFASFFLKEIPLRKSHRPTTEKAGVELAVGEGEFSAKDEPNLKQ